MSILDALRVQKAEQQSVRELAMLPQQMIIQMAQRGDIPAEVAPVVINEKARIAKEMANVQAMMARQAQGTPPTVLEQAMTANARAENPQPPAQPPMPQGMPQAAPQGVAGLPTPPGMFNEQSYAGGGIVAFAGEGRSDISLSDIVRQQQRQDPSFAGMFAAEAPAASGEELPGFRRRYQSLADALREVQSLTGPMRDMSAEEIAFQEYLTKSKPRTEAEATQSGWLRALEAGLGIMGGTSPYALSNIGKGAETAVKGFSEDVKERRKGELSTMAAAAQQARQKRLEGIEDVKSAQHLLEKDLEAEYRQAVLDKSDRLDKSTKIYFDKMVAAGADPKDPNTMAAARDMAYSQEGLAAAKLTQRGIEEEGDRAQSALTNTRNELAKDNQYRLLSAKALGGKTPAEKAERQSEANTYALGVLNKNRAAVGLSPLTTYPGSAPAQAAPKGSAPDLSKVQGIPAGAKTGKLTAKGWEVFDSEGKLIGHIKE